MFQKKMPVSQAPDKNEFTVYNPHTISLNSRNWPDVVNVISIDPGIRNFTLRVESRGIRSDKYPIKTLVYDKLKITDEQRKLEGNVDNLFLLITQFLDKYLQIFKKCHIMIIERQIPTNYKAVRISQHTISYFLFHLKNILPALPMVFEVDPKLKGRELGASKHLNERGLKQWAVDKAKELLVKRGDYEALEVLQKNKRKADDHADTLVQIEAIFSFNKWPLTPEISQPSVSQNSVSQNSPNSQNSVSQNFKNSQSALEIKNPLPLPTPPSNKLPSNKPPSSLTLKISKENVPAPNIIKEECNKNNPPKLILKVSNN